MTVKFRTILLCLSLAVLASCRTEDIFQKPFEEGVPVRATLRFGVEHSPVITRAAQESQYEYRVNNLYVFIFNSSGGIHYRKFFREGTGLMVNNGEASCNGTVSFETSSVQGATIVGIANVYEENVTTTSYRISEADLNEVTSFDDLYNRVMNMESNSIFRGDLFMMTGYAKKDGSTKIDINGDAGGTTTLDCTLMLERTDAKIQFNVTSQIPDDKVGQWSDFSFTPVEWQVCRVPVQSFILEHPETEDAEGQYFNTVSRTFETIVSNGTTDIGGGFVFYMPENKKTPKMTIGEPDPVKAYALREESESEPFTDPSKPGQTIRNTVFRYANENSTYVVLTGKLAYTDNSGDKISPVDADVKCYIHLGYGDEPADANDYNTRRNTHYIYNVTIKGINDITVEVESSTGIEIENRPGYEGDIVLSSKKIFELDSHYDRALLSISINDIGDDMTWAVTTPFSSGLHNPALGDGVDDTLGDEEFKGIEDYKWIKFAINSDYGTPADEYVKYPGDLNYNNQLIDISNRTNNQPSPYYSNLGHSAARLLDIQQLIERLKREKASGSSTIFDSEGNVHITAFVDENLYIRDPASDPNDPSQTDLRIWKLMAERPDRQLHIISQEASYSHDGNSSLINSIYSFKQKSIRTVYNVDNPDLATAWGLESTMETGRLVPLSNTASNISAESTSASNGRANTLLWTVGKKWTDMISVSSGAMLNQSYNSAAYACMLRNRDLNGDNEVQANEVRWYLASISQLTDIFLGEYALDEASRLYPSNAADRENQVRWHYASSSLGGKNNPVILWAEEGASRGNASGSSAFPGENPKRFAYRCIRNLGIPLGSEDQIPEDLVSVQRNSDGSYVMDMNRMNVKSRRTNYALSLPQHHERSQNNLTYDRFEVNAATHPTPELRWYDRWNTNGWSYYQTNNPCPVGWRVPNLRELLIMSTRMEKSDWKTFSDRYNLVYYEIRPHYMCYTGFSLNGKSGYDSERLGFIYNSKDDIIFLRNGSGDVGYVRCVRDLQD